MKLWLEFSTLLIGFSGLLTNSEITPFNCSGTIYIRPNTSQLSWTEAQNVCRNFNATLPIVDNPDHQNCFITALSYFNANKTYVWMGANSSGGYPSVWKWLDGSTYNGPEILPESTYQQTYANVTLNGLGLTGFTFNASKPTEKHPYICQYPKSGNNNCANGMGTQTILSNDRCYVIINTEELWFSARNKCLSKGGDLASFPDAPTLNKTISTLTDNKSYWIGLRSSFWNWIDVVAGLKMDVTYTLWSENQPDGVGGDLQCLSTDYESNVWRDVNCSAAEEFICQITASLSSSSTKATDKIILPPLTTAGIYTSDRGAVGNQNNLQNTDGNSKNDGGNIALGVGIGIGVGVPLLIAVIAVGAFLCCRHRKSSQQSRAIPKNPKTSSPSDVTIFQSSNSEYAEIPKIQGQNDSNTTSQYSNIAIQNTTVYAPLEIVSSNSN